MWRRTRRKKICTVDESVLIYFFLSATTVGEEECWISLVLPHIWSLPWSFWVFTLLLQNAQGYRRMLSWSLERNIMSYLERLGNRHCKCVCPDCRLGFPDIAESSIILHRSRFRHLHRICCNMWIFSKALSFLHCWSHPWIVCLRANVIPWQRLDAKYETDPTSLQCAVWDCEERISSKDCHK
jgi:hypothetical protein